MTDSRYWPKETIEQFISLYRSCTALWKIDSKEYKSQYLKNCAYEKLIRFCREKVNPEANRDFVAKRIQGLRGSFRKEAKKAETAGRKPTLWYYDLLLFTKEQDENAGNPSQQAEEAALDNLDEDTNIKQDTRYWSKDIMESFIDLYKSLPALWKISCDEYKNKHLKTQSYEKMVEFCRKNIYSEADRDFVIKKIQSFRGVFRKHYNKVIASRRTALTEEDVYKPDLWYYDLLLFLKDHEESDDSNYENFLFENDLQAVQVPLDRKTFTENLINMYRSSPCLWKVSHEDYTNRYIRDQTIQKMVTYSKRMYPHANREYIIRKLQSLRAAFRREHKKFLASKKNASCDDETYRPILWYYDLLTFIEGEEDMDDFEEQNEDEMESLQHVNNIENQEFIDIKEEPIFEDEDHQELLCFSVPQKGVKRKLQNEEHDFESSISSGFEFSSTNTEPNEYEAVGINVTKKLQRMDPTQAVYAEALIVKVLGMGLLKRLNGCTEVNENISKF